ncbi:MAG: ThiF family adenylyltransferase [Planctomycetales bacterium]|nr:ThiF family adenylyltransferase [Planctomycetales bacterium]
MTMSEDVLRVDDDDRYSRLRLIAWWDQERLANAHVLVVGAGALGNEVLKNLALMGIGKITIVDFDEIEESNLTRSVLFRHRDCGRNKADVAADALRDMNPDVDVRPFRANIITDIGLGFFADADVVIGCLDNREARLWVNRSCWKVTTPWIDGGIQEINGVAKTFIPPDGACYECAMTENDYRLISLRYSCPLLRQEDILAGKVPTAPTISSIIAGIQTQEALKLIHDMPVAEGAAMVFNGQANRFYTTKYPFKEDCLSHDTWDVPVEVPLRAADNTGRDLLAAASGRLSGNGPLTIQLERDLVVRLDCVCGNRRNVMRAREAVAASEAVCPDCGELAKPFMVHSIDADSELATATLRELGIPPYDIVRVAQANEECFLLLAGDRNG